MDYRNTVFVAFAVVFFAGSISNAEEPQDVSKQFFGVSAGIKGGVGGNYITPPDNVASYQDDLPFADGAGGPGGGAGLYTEFRVLWGWLGLEFDLMFDKSKNSCEIEYGPVDTTWIIRSSAVRMPLLLKGNIDGETTRVSFGLGPEFVIIHKTETDLESDTEAAAISYARNNFSAKTGADTFLCFDLGLAIKVWRLAITIDLRYSLNVGQPKDLGDRVTYVAESDSVVVTTIASNTMDGRFLLGVAYEFGFDI